LKKWVSPSGFRLGFHQKQLSGRPSPNSGWMSLRFGAHFYSSYPNRAAAPCPINAVDHMNVATLGQPLSPPFLGGFIVGQGQGIATQEFDRPHPIMGCLLSVRFSSGRHPSSSTNPIYLLMALNWLKQYKVKEEMVGWFKLVEKTAQKWTQLYTHTIQVLRTKKLSTATTTCKYFEYTYCFHFCVLLDCLVMGQQEC
jgi:hypothetical protein